MEHQQRQLAEQEPEQRLDLLRGQPPVFDEWSPERLQQVAADSGGVVGATIPVAVPLIAEVRGFGAGAHCGRAV